MVGGMNVTPQSINDYRKFLRLYNPLTDCSWHEKDHRVRLTDEELARFRNNPQLAWCQRTSLASRRTFRMFRGAGTPTLGRLTEHLVNQQDRTIWATNSADKKSLLMLADLDNKDGNADVAGAAKYVVERYLNGHGIIERSTGGLGRHVYFKGLRYPLTGEAYCEIFRSLAQVVRDDPQLHATGVTLDNVFYGLPTIWERDRDGVWRVKRRGDLLRLPYVEQSDLSSFQALPEIDPAFFRRLLPAQIVRPIRPSLPQSNTEDSIGRTRQSRPKADHDDGLARRMACWSEVMRLTNGACSTDDCLAFYHTHYKYTDMREDDIRRRRLDFERLDRIYGPEFRPAIAHPWAFTAGRYTELVMRLVPEHEFVWARRERLNHARLADFSGVKVQDAFRPKRDDQYFGRASRQATVSYFRIMRLHGRIDWICTSNIYTKLLGIAIRYGLLECFENFVRPTTTAAGRKISPGKGLARMVGPGPALVAERAAFMPLYRAWGARQRMEERQSA
jgi:hypothetical protein